MVITQCTIIRASDRYVFGVGTVPVYHLQVTYDRGIVRRIDLDDAPTLEQAQVSAAKKGYEVAHWMHAGDQHVMEIT